MQRITARHDSTITPSPLSIPRTKNSTEGSRPIAPSLLCWIGSCERKEAMSERFCHYCEKPKCKCKYRSGRKGEFSIDTQNLSRQTTIGEMRNFMKNYITMD